MTSLQTVWQVARREITERGRSKAYLITSVVTLLLVAGVILVPSLFQGGPDEYSVGTVGEGNAGIVEAAEALGTVNDEPDEEPSVSIDEISYDTREEGEAAVESEEIDALLVDGNEIVVETTSGIGGSPLVALLQRGAASIELELAVSEGGQAATDVIEIMTSDPLEVSTLSGREADGEDAGLLAYAGLMLLYIAILLYGTWILSGVTEEKSNRVVEVLLSSVKAWQLLAGKIAGIGTLGLAQLSGTIAVALIALQATDSFELPPVAASSVINLIVWFVLGFLLFAVMFGAAGSLVSRMEDAQNVAFPMSMVAVAGFFVSIIALDNPDGVAAVVGSFVPLTAPFVVPVRAALDAIPVWQYALSVVVTAATIAGMTLVAGRIYSGALLRFGGRTKLREAWNAAGD